MLSNKLQIDRFKKKRKKHREHGKNWNAAREQNTEKSLTSGLLQQSVVSKTDKARMIKWQGSLWSNRDKRGIYTVFKTLFYYCNFQYIRTDGIQSNFEDSIPAQMAQTALALQVRRMLSAQIMDSNVTKE